MIPDGQHHQASRNMRGLPARMPFYDDIQAIYKGRERPVWRQLGIEAQGRTTVLKVNYRNTAQIVAFARRFASDVIGAPGTIADDEHAILLPEDAGRQGLVPEVQQCVSVDAEAHCIAEWFLERKKAGYEWPQMACLYPEHWIGERVAQALAKHEVRSIWSKTTGTEFRRSGWPCGS